MANSTCELGIAYKKIEAHIHPTKLTHNNGEPLPEVNASDIGIQYADEPVATPYYFDELFFDSALEKENIKDTPQNYKDCKVIVFTKIPKNSIKIPVPGGKSYSPDFAYIIECKGKAQKIHFVVEVKDKEERELTQEEKIKLKLGNIFLHKTMNIIFLQQLKKSNIKQILNHILKY